MLHVSLLKQNTTKKERVDENVTELKFDIGDSKEYKVEAIWDSVVYTNKSERGHLLGLYYLVAWKSCLEEENTWEPALTVQHLRKLIGLFYKNHLDKPTATSLPSNCAPPIARSTVKPTRPIKRKQSQPASSANK